MPQTSGWEDAFPLENSNLLSMEWGLQKCPVWENRWVRLNRSSAISSICIYYHIYIYIYSDGFNPRWRLPSGNSSPWKITPTVYMICPWKIATTFHGKPLDCSCVSGEIDAQAWTNTLYIYLGVSKNGETAKVAILNWEHDYHSQLFTIFSRWKSMST